MRHLLPFAIFLTLLDADLIRAALRHADISLTKAAIWMAMDRALLERQLEGEGHLSHRRLLMLPLGFWRWMSLLQVERYGMPQSVRRAVPLQIALMGRRRMARVEFNQQKAEQAS